MKESSSNYLKHNSLLELKNLLGVDDAKLVPLLLAHANDAQGIAFDNTKKMRVSMPAVLFQTVFRVNIVADQQLVFESVVH